MPGEEDNTEMGRTSQVGGGAWKVLCFDPVVVARSVHWQLLELYMCDMHFHMSHFT